MDLTKVVAHSFTYKVHVKVCPQQFCRACSSQDALPLFRPQRGGEFPFLRGSKSLASTRSKIRRSLKPINGLIYPPHRKALSVCARVVSSYSWGSTLAEMHRVNTSEVACKQAIRSLRELGPNYTQSTPQSRDKRQRAQAKGKVLKGRTVQSVQTSSLHI